MTRLAQPTYTPDLARLLADMIETEHYGRYHATNEGLCTSVRICLRDFQTGRNRCQGNTCDKQSVSAKAKRPSNSRMNREKLVKNGFTPLPKWQDALKRYLALIGE